jgi:sulfite exporter TauE/SafE
MPVEIDLLAMFLLGLAGTGHCLGMCGPLVAAIPGQTGRWSAHLAYHAGRLTTYTLIGAGLGAVSGSLNMVATTSQGPMLWVLRLQIVISLGTALLLLVLGLYRLGFVIVPQRRVTFWPEKIPGVGHAISQGLNHQREAVGKVFLFGLFLGLLPCGLSYAAFARTLASGGLWNGAWMALAFGVGTLPGLLLLGTGVSAFWRRHRHVSEIISGMIMVGMALMLVVRL